MTHTPGPWRLNAGNETEIMAGRLAIARAHCGGTTAINLAEAEANACLIAVAPDLLDLVIQYRNDLKYPVAPDSRERRLAAIDAAIARATGAA